MSDHHKYGEIISKYIANTLIDNRDKLAARVKPILQGKFRRISLFMIMTLMRLFLAKRLLMNYFQRRRPKTVRIWMFLWLRWLQKIRRVTQNLQ